MYDHVCGARATWSGTWPWARSRAEGVRGRVHLPDEHAEAGQPPTLPGSGARNSWLRWLGPRSWPSRTCVHARPTDFAKRKEQRQTVNTPRPQPVRLRRKRHHNASPRHSCARCRGLCVERKYKFLLFVYASRPADNCCLSFYMNKLQLIKR